MIFIKKVFLCLVLLMSFVLSAHASGTAGLDVPLTDLPPATSSSASMHIEAARDLKTPPPPSLPPVLPHFREYEVPNLERLESIIESSDSLVGKAYFWDLDGVLTLNAQPLYNIGGTLTYSPPAEYLIEAIVVPPNLRAIEVLRKAAAKGAACLIVSAWDKFEETLYKVQQLGLAELMGIKTGETSHHHSLQIDGFPPLIYYRQGNAVSVRYLHPSTPDDLYYRQKAFALMAWNEDRRTYESAESFFPIETNFIDDSSGNISIFSTDLNHWLSTSRKNILGEKCKTVNYLTYETPRVEAS